MAFFFNFSILTLISFPPSNVGVCVSVVFIVDDDVVALVSTTLTVDEVVVVQL